MSSNFDNNSNLTVDEKKLGKIKVKVYNLERNNFTTKKLSDAKMIEEIQKIINMEANNDN